MFRHAGKSFLNSAKPSAEQREDVVLQQANLRYSIGDQS